LPNSRPAADLSELGGSVRALHADHVYGERAAEAQSWLIYDRLGRILQSTGASLEHLVKVNAYFDDAADIAPFQRIGALSLDGALHATAPVPVKRAGRTLDHVLVADGVAIID
jgi:enamine deaminase RidA (YjgF/YER057c/UK114 family)